MPMRRALSIFFALLWHISGENLWRIFNDPTRSLWEPLKIFKILVNIFRDISFSCLDLQGSFIFLPRSLRIFHFPVKTFEDLVRISKDLDKNFKDPLKRSLKILWGSSKFLLRSLKIHHFLAKIFKDLLIPCQDPERSWQENFEDPWRSWQEN